MRGLRKGLVLFGVVVAARALYILVEGSYNAALLKLASSPLVTTTHAATVESLGHKLAAIGIGLLLAPVLVHAAAKAYRGRISSASQAALFAAFFVSVYTSTFHLQSWVMDKAVESASAESRYEAYYLSLFRQLYLDGSVEDPGLSETDGLIGISMLAMPFAWADAADVASFLREEGQELVLDRAQKQAIVERFEGDFVAYKTLQEKTFDFLDDYRLVSERALSVSDPDLLAPAHWYGKSIERLYSLFPAYKAMTARWAEHLRRTGNSTSNFRSVQGIFSASVNERQWRHSVFVNELGLPSHAITLDMWCKDGRCPHSSGHIKSVISTALTQHYANQAYGVSPGMSLKGFLQDPMAINAVVRQLGLTSDPSLFEGGPVTYMKFKSASGQLGMGQDISDELEGAYPFLKDMTLPAGMADSEIIESPAFKRWIGSEFGERMLSFPLDLNRSQFFQHWLRQSDDVIQESTSVILPGDSASMLNDEIRPAGTAAIKLMYIPPVAAFLSAAMILLSLCSIGHQVGSYFYGRQTGLVVMIVVGVVFAGGGYLLADDPMPTPLMNEVWNAYTAERSILEVVWRVFFGIGRMVETLTLQGTAVIPSETINTVLDSVLGWAI